jgi:hypothetical protein
MRYFGWTHIEYRRDKRLSAEPDDASQRPHSWCTAGTGRQQSYRCTINMYLIRMSWLRGAGTAKTGRDQGRSGGAEKTAIIRPNFGVIRGIPVFPGPPLALGALQRWMQMHIG